MSEAASARGVRVIAPSGPLHPDALDAGLARLAELGIAADWPAGWREGVMAADGHLAGSDEHRATQLRDAIVARPSAIWMARGGYGALRTLDAARRQGELFDGEPVPLWGFSDGTVLLSAWDRAGWPGWHAPPMTQLPRLDDESIARVRATWHADHIAPFEDLVTLAPGQAEGALAGGNLCMLASIVGTPWEARFEGRVVLLEEVGEPAYKVDRLFTQLRLSGAFDRAVALVLGDFSALDATQSAAVAAFFAAEAKTLGIPVVTNAPFGHDRRNAPLPFGEATGYRALVDAPEGGPARLVLRR
ncbi:MAG: LD-carboxypeptidase [Deltaproteobacteria bacterium]|nr:LD-carboxypeptidase [Deltaproteobacteria bacterium]MCB9786829.1 LD-carboxypeptidase [Deltaproteobacteria bacterium]